MFHFLTPCLKSSTKFIYFISVITVYETFILVWQQMNKLLLDRLPDQNRFTTRPIETLAHPHGNQ